MSLTFKTGINWTKLAIALALMCSLFGFSASAQTTPDDPLDEEAVSALLDELKDGLPDLIEDEDQVSAIIEKWDAHEDLAGKPLLQILKILFADVRSVVKDKETLDAVWANWNEPDESEKVVPDNPTPQPSKPVTQQNAAAQEPKAGTVSRSKLPGGVEISFSYIPAGEFKMGGNGPLDGANPVRTVRLSKGFWMQTTELTQAQWKAVMRSFSPDCFVTISQTRPLEQKFIGDQRPVVCVTWNDTQEYVRQLNLKNDGYHYRLPTEAEWEYAARAGSDKDGPGDLDSIAWYNPNAGGVTHNVATKEANAWGLYDMYGNAAEWVHTVGPNFAVYRGGDWAEIDTFLYPAYRRGTEPEMTSNGRGFRIVREAGLAPTRQPAVAPAMSGPPAGTLSRVTLEDGVEMSFAYIPAGEFLMGSLNGHESERPVHSVRLSKGFWMQTTEVTQAQWMAVVGDLPQKCRYTDENKEAIPERQRGDLYPVVCMSWTDVQEFFRLLNEKKDGYRYRLPTEAEWEYAARARTVGDYAGDFNSIVVHGVPVQHVASKKPNGWGLYDMHGNVSEYVQDKMSAYPAGTVTDPVANRGSYSILRGGSIGNPVETTRSSYRMGTSGSTTGSEIIGFRVVRIKE
jgi:formylglycine-generating enzyme required for sulfatase activity